MKNKLKGLLAVALSAACFLSTTPIAGFAAGKQTITVGEGTFSAVDAEGNSITELSVIEGDVITSDENGRFNITINGEKAAEGYGENTYEGYAENNADSEKSGNTYYDSFTVPAAPKGYKDGAELSVKQTDDYYVHGDNFHLGNSVNLEYEPVSYKVIFNLNGGEGIIEPVETKYGTEFTLPDSDSAVKDGLNLTGWNTVSDGSGENYAPGEAVKNLAETDGTELVLFAQWGENTEGDTEEETKEYTVTYYLSETEQYGEAQKYAEGAQIILPEAPSKEGFKFAGWILGEENGSAIKMPETMPANDIKAYASWEIQNTTIKYIVDSEEYSVKSAAYGSDIILTVPEDPAKEGYVFAGWFDGNGNNLYSYTTVPASDVTFTAKWLKNGNVVYMVDDKTYEAYEVTEGEEIPVPENPEKFAYKFKGWSPEVPSAMPAEDLTFSAQWELDKDFITVVVGGTVIAGGIITAIVGAGAAAITGISIIGGIIALIGAASGINRTYTVTYKVDGSVYKTYKLEAGSKITVPADPTKDGYKFTGWTPEIPDEMPKKNLTFEATWSEIDDDTNVGTDIPSTGSTKAGIAAFAALALSAAAAIIIKKKRSK